MTLELGSTQNRMLVVPRRGNSNAVALIAILHTLYPVRDYMSQNTRKTMPVSAYDYGVVFMEEIYQGLGQISLMNRQTCKSLKYRT